MKTKQKTMLLSLLAAALLLSVGLITFTVAKYMSNEEVRGATIADQFYLRSDFMYPTEVLLASEPDASKAVWHIGRKQFVINLYNFEDTLRVTKDPIDVIITFVGVMPISSEHYVNGVWVSKTTTQPPDVGHLISEDDPKYAEYFDNNQVITFAGQIDGGGDAGNRTEVKITLNRIEGVDVGYVIVKSTAPYSKTIMGEFNFQNTELTCEMVDSSERVNATLRLTVVDQMQNANFEIMYPTKELFPDLTNRYLSPEVTSGDVSITEVDETYSKITIQNMTFWAQTSLELEFFKDVVATNYTMDLHSIEPVLDGTREVYKVKIEAKSPAVTPPSDIANQTS